MPDPAVLPIDDPAASAGRVTIGRQPVLYLSHGSPMLVFDDTPARDFLKSLLARLPMRPRALLVITAHWETERPSINLSQGRRVQYDFRGFPDALYQIDYPAPEAPELSQRVVGLLAESGIPCTMVMDRPRDHGTWVPLVLMNPAADIPVLEMSVMPHASARDHRLLGKALKPLRDEGVLIIGSGSMTHSLADVWGNDLDATEPQWVADFADFCSQKLVANQPLDDWQTAPHAARNHPSPEHFLPLPVAQGAGDAIAKRIHSSTTFGVLRMDVWQWD